MTSVDGPNPVQCNEKRKWSWFSLAAFWSTYDNLDKIQLIHTAAGV